MAAAWVAEDERRAAYLAFEVRDRAGHLGEDPFVGELSEDGVASSVRGHRQAFRGKSSQLITAEDGRTRRRRSEAIREALDDGRDAVRGAFLEPCADRPVGAEPGVRPGERQRTGRCQRTRRCRRISSVRRARVSVEQVLRLDDGVTWPLGQRFMEAVPPERAIRAIRIGGRNEEDRRDAEPAQDRPGHLRHIAVSIVDGDQDSALRQWRVSSARVEQFIE